MSTMQSKISTAQATGLVKRLFSMRGMTVSLQAQKVGEGEWVLRIHGTQGQVSEWMQCFDSAVEAMTVGLSAIQSEGIERFYDDPILAHHNAQSGSPH